MNDWNEWENQLRSWTLRRPSPKLRERIFPKPAQAREDVFPGWEWQRIAVLGACLFFAVLLLTPRSSQLAYFAGYATNQFLAAAVSNQSYTAYMTAGLHSGQNRVQMDAVQWAPPDGIESLFPLLQTNTTSH